MRFANSSLDKIQVSNILTLLFNHFNCGITIIFWYKIKWQNRESENHRNGEKSATSVITCNSLQSLRLNEYGLRQAFPLLFFCRVNLNRYDRNFIHLMIICVIQIDTYGMLHSRMCNSLFSHCWNDLLC